MKKKIIILAIALLVVCCSLFALTACNNGDGDLQYGVKYTYYSLEDAEHVDYYVFEKNGTGILRYSYKSSNTDYTLHFKYTFIDKDKSMVACYFDSVEIHEGKKDYFNDSRWNRVLLVSKNTVLETSSGGYACYVNENYYSSEIPNYEKVI